MPGQSWSTFADLGLTPVGIGPTLADSKPHLFDTGWTRPHIGPKSVGPNPIFVDSGPTMADAGVEVAPTLVKCCPCPNFCQTLPGFHQLRPHSDPCLADLVQLWASSTAFGPMLANIGMLSDNLRARHAWCRWQTPSTARPTSDKPWATLIGFPPLLPTPRSSADVGFLQGHPGAHNWHLRNPEAKLVRAICSLAIFGVPDRSAQPTRLEGHVTDTPGCASGRKAGGTSRRPNPSLEKPIPCEALWCRRPC